MIPIQRGLTINKDTNNIEPFVSYLSVDIVTQQFAGSNTITTNTSTNNYVTIIALNAADGFATIDLRAPMVHGYIVL
jgi:hypothetical protein